MAVTCFKIIILKVTQKFWQPVFVVFEYGPHRTILQP